MSIQPHAHATVFFVLLIEQTRKHLVSLDRLIGSKYTSHLLHTHDSPLLQLDRFFGCCYRHNRAREFF